MNGDSTEIQRKAMPEKNFFPLCLNAQQLVSTTIPMVEKMLKEEKGKNAPSLFAAIIV